MTEWGELNNRIHIIEEMTINQWKWIDAIIDYLRDKDPDFHDHMFPYEGRERMSGYNTKCPVCSGVGKVFNDMSYEPYTKQCERCFGLGKIKNE